MPRYHFDVVQGPRAHRDPEGEALPGPEEARLVALETLGDMARDGARACGDDDPALTIVVRDAAGHPVLRASVRLSVERLG